MLTMEDELDAILSQIDPKQLLSLESATFDLPTDDSTSSSSRLSATFPLQVQGPPHSNQPHPTSAASSSRFQTLTTDDDVEEAKKRATPQNTDKNTATGQLT